MSFQMERKQIRHRSLRRRRPSSLNEIRDYICSCGKSYLSYTALWTHIRLKHNGMPPGKIIVPAKDPGRIKRGRPVSNPDVVKYVTATNIDLNDDEFDENSLQRFCQQLTQQEKIQACLRPKLKQIYASEPFYQTYLQFDPVKFNPFYNEQQDMYEAKCDEVLCQFLSEAISKLPHHFHWDVSLLFVILFAKAIQNKFNGDTSAIKREPAKNLIQYPNNVFLVVLPEWKKYQVFSQLSTFLNDRLAKMIEYFYGWLGKKKYICVRVKMNFKYYDIQ